MRDRTLRTDPVLISESNIPAASDWTIPGVPMPWWLRTPPEERAHSRWYCFCLISTTKDVGRSPLGKVSLTVSKAECEFGESDRVCLRDGQVGTAGKSCRQLKRHLKIYHTTFILLRTFYLHAIFGIGDSDRDPNRLLGLCSCDYGIAIDRDWDGDFKSLTLERLYCREN